MSLMNPAKTPATMHLYEGGGRSGEKCRFFGSPDVLVVTQDLSVEDSCDLVMEQTIQHFGGKTLQGGQ